MSGPKISDAVLEQMRKGNGLDRGIAAAIDAAVAAAVAEEREACADVADQMLFAHHPDVAAAIRARGKS